MEIRRKCNVCGKIYCYTDEDVENSKIESVIATISTIGAIASAVGGTNYDAYELNKQSDRATNKVIDYLKCPFCNSSDTHIMSKEECERTNTNSSTYNNSIQINSNATVESLLKRISIFLEDEEWDSATVYCEQALDINPECALAYLYELMAKLHVTEQVKLAELLTPLDNEKLYQKAVRFADDNFRSVICGYNDAIIARNNENGFKKAMDLYNSAQSYNDYMDVARKFKDLGDYKDSSSRASECEVIAARIKYDKAVEKYETSQEIDDIVEAKEEFEFLGDYNDSKLLVQASLDKIKRLKKNQKIRSVIFVFFFSIICFVGLFALIYFCMPK